MKRADEFRPVRGFYSRALFCVPLLAMLIAGFSCFQRELGPDMQQEVELLLERDRESIVPLPPTKEFAKDALLVYAGILVDKVYELSLVSRTFSAEIGRASCRERV